MGLRGGGTSVMVAVLLVATAARAQKVDVAVPETLVTTTGERVWVGAGHAAALVAAPPKGALRGALPELDWFFRGLAALTTDSGLFSRLEPCIYFVGVQVTHPNDWGGYDFDSLITDWGGMIDGTVIARKSGFYRGAPEMLLLVRVDEWLAREVPVATVREIYLRYVPTRFDIAGVPVCRPEHGLPAAPHVGDRILATSGWPPFDKVKGARPVLNSGRGVFFERNGKVFTSDDIASATAEWPQGGSLDETKERAAALLGLAPTTPVDVGRGSASPVVGRTFLAVDLGGDGVLTSSAATEPVQFDIDGDGALDQTGWLIGAASDAFLWVDSNRNGEVDGVGELLGSSGPAPGRMGRETANGFARLALWDRRRFGGNVDGRLDRRDMVWRRLLIWADRNNDGVSQADEVSRLGEHAAAYIELARREIDRADGSLNRIVAVGQFWVRGAGGGLRQRQIAEVKFRTSTRDRDQ